MTRAPICAAVSVLSFLVLSCHGGSERSSPTEPAPAPQPAVALPGKWTGTMVLNRSGQPRMTCSMEVELDDIDDPQFFFGDWTLQCPDGTGGSEQVVATLLPLQFVSLIGFPSTRVLDGCPWSGVFPRQGKRLTGDWQKDSNPTGTCQASSIQGGTVDLTKAD